MSDQLKSSGSQDIPSESKSLDAFFTDCPPQTLWEINPDSVSGPTHANRYAVGLPTIQLFCVLCEGLMNFAPTSEVTTRANKFEDWFIEYVCRNCGHESKTFAVSFGLKTQKGVLEAVKYGEFPPFGPPLPARLQRLFQGDVELLKKRISRRKMGIWRRCFYVLSPSRRTTT